MLISGLQKMTLLDYPGRVACTVFTGGCNFRCPFCHNASLVIPEALRAADGGVEAILAFLKKRQGLLDGVAITGGEPLLHADMADFLRQIRALGYQIKLDTNGSFPERLISLVEEGLIDRVAMDIKNAPGLYAETAGFPLLDIAPIERSKNYLLEGHVEYEFRTTVVRIISSSSRTPASCLIRTASARSMTTRCARSRTRCARSSPPCSCAAWIKEREKFFYTI